MNRKAGLVLFICVFSLFWSCDQNPTEPEMQAANEVLIQNRQFVPQTLTVGKGTTVRWTNKDDVAHTVDSGKPMNPTSLFNLKTLQPNESGTHTFTGVGTFDYFCSIHGETGRIIVK